MSVSGRKPEALARACAALKYNVVAARMADPSVEGPRTKDALPVVVVPEPSMGLRRSIITINIKPLGALSDVRRGTATAARQATPSMPRPAQDAAVGRVSHKAKPSSAVSSQSQVKQAPTATAAAVYSEPLMSHIRHASLRFFELSFRCSKRGKIKIRSSPALLGCFPAFVVISSFLSVVVLLRLLCRW